MLQLNLKAIFEARGIDNPYSFLKKQGFTHNIAVKLANNKKPTLHLDYIELLCKRLWCEPSDLFTWQPDKDAVIPSEHPLFSLSDSGKKKTNIKNLLSILSQVPYKKLNDLSDLLVNDLRKNISPDEK